MDDIVIRKATAEDIDQIFTLVNSNANQGLMLSRSKYRICSVLANFLVATNPAGELIGCGSLIPLWVDLAEIVSLAVRADLRGKGVGRILVQRLVEESRQLKINTVMALTYQVEFFSKLGYSVANKDEFPRKVWRECLECPKLEQCDETAMKLELAK